MSLSSITFGSRGPHAHCRYSHTDLGPGSAPRSPRGGYDPYNPYDSQPLDTPSFPQDEGGLRGYDPYARDDPYVGSGSRGDYGGLNGGSPAPPPAADYHDYGSINRYSLRHVFGRLAALPWQHACALGWCG